MSDRYLIGIDLGTTQTKTGLIGADGRLLRLGYGTYPIHTEDGPGCAEQDPDDWWRAICNTLKEVVQDIDPSEVAAICVSGQGPTVVMTDADARPLSNAVTWMDGRASTEAEVLSQRLGSPVSPFSFLPKAMWIKTHHPEAYQRATWFLPAWDYIAFRLSGQAVVSSSGTQQAFPQDQMEAAGLNPKLSAPAAAIGKPIGKLTAAASRDTGMPQGILVVAGVSDGMGTFIGSGLTKSGRTVDTGGTSGGLGLCWHEPLEAPGILSGPGILPDQFIAGGAMNGLGKALDWFLEVFEDPSVSHTDLIERAQRIQAGADGLIFLPYLAGERSPIWDPKARGVFIGLSLQHNRDHLARAVLEASAYAIRQIAQSLLDAGGEISEVRVCGGQAQSDVISQIKADVLGLPVAVPRVTECALMGAAVLAGVGAGLFPDIASSSEKMVQIKKSMQPDPDLHERYSEMYSIYERLYPALQETFHQLSDIVH